MRTLATTLSLLLTISLVAGQPLSATAQEIAPSTSSPSVAAIQAKWKQAEELDRRGQRAEAIQAAEQVLAMLQTSEKAQPVDLVGTMTFLARLHQRSDNHAEAIRLRAEILNLLEKVFGNNHWRTTDARLSLNNLRTTQQMTAEQRRELEQATDHEDRCQTLRNQGKIDEAVTLGRKIVDTRVKLFGEQHIAACRAHGLLASLLQQQGDYAAAEKEYQASLAIAANILGENHPETGASVSNLGGMYRDVGQTAKAETLYLRAVAISKATKGEEDPDFASSLDNLALVYQDQRVFEKAESLHLQALSIRRKALGEQHMSTTVSLNNLASLYLEQARFKEAEVLLEQSVAIRRKLLGEQHPDVASSLHNLAHLYTQQGDLAGAEANYRRCLSIVVAAYGERHTQTAATLNNLAEVYRQLGDFDKAESLHKRSLTIDQSIFGDQHLSTADSINNLAIVYYSRGDYARAEPLYRQCVDIYRQIVGDKHPQTATAFGNLATLYRAIGDFAKSEPLYRECLAIREEVLPPDHPDLALTRSSLAALYQDMGYYAQAEELYTRSLSSMKNTVGEDHPMTAQVMANLAALYVLQRDHAKAEPLFRQALDIREQTLGSKHPLTLESTHQLGMMYYFQNDLRRAEPLLEESSRSCAEVLGEAHPDTSRMLSDLAFVHFRRADWDKAESLARRALESSRISLETTAVIQSERQQLAMAQKLNHRIDGYVSIAAASRRFSDQAYQTVLQWKGATLVRQRQMRLVASDGRVANLFQQLQRNATRLATLSRAPPDSQQQDSWRDQISQLILQKDQLEAELSRQSAAFRQAHKRVTVAEIQSVLPDKSVLIDFLEYSRHVRDEDRVPDTIRSLAAFVVRKDQPVIMINLGPVAPLSEAIDTWRSTLGTSTASAAAGRLLRERIWEPVEMHLAGAGIVFVSTDGTLGRLPFAALPGKKPATYLLEEYRLALLPVPQLLPALVNDLGRTELDRRLLLVGDVNYEDATDVSNADTGDARPTRSSTAMVRGTQSFAPLAGTAVEIAEIEKLYRSLFDARPGTVTTIKQQAATEQVFRDVASQYSFLHLATHGFFAAADQRAINTAADQRQSQLLAERDQMVRGLNPGLLSGLVFSGANRKPDLNHDDGIMTADEIAALGLDGVDLVVLSACETGLGEVAGGEGLLGVQRAFQVAGVHATVASLWNVDDRATERLMNEFYRNLWEKKLSKLDALRDAQLSMLRSYDGETGQLRGDKRLKASSTPAVAAGAPPQLWAAFTLSGDWN